MIYFFHSPWRERVLQDQSPFLREGGGNAGGGLLSAIGIHLDQTSGKGERENEVKSNETG